MTQKMGHALFPIPRPMHRVAELYEGINEKIVGACLRVRGSWAPCPQSDLAGRTSDIYGTTLVTCLSQSFGEIS